MLKTLSSFGLLKYMSMNNTESKEFEMSSVTKNKIMVIKTDEITFLKIINNSKLILLFFLLSSAWE